MNNFLKYSNSWGHLLISIILIAAGTILVLVSADGVIRGMGVWMITTASSYWFVSSVAAHGNNQGQQGIQGEQGAQGPPGAQGIAVHVATVEVPEQPPTNGGTS